MGGDIMTTSMSTPTVGPNDHVAAAAYLMRHDSVTTLLVLSSERSDQPMGIITDSHIAQAAADGKDLNEVRIYELMDTHPGPSSLM
jgi:CBS domain-containing protein